MLERIGVVAVTALALGMAWRDALGLDGPWDAFVAQQPRAMILLALRLALLIVAGLATSVRRPTRGAYAMMVAVALLFAASLAWRLMLVPFVAASLATVFLGAPPRASVFVLAALATAVASLTLAPSRVEAIAPTDPAAATAYWRRAENPFRARAAAFKWAQHEGSAFGEGYLALAEIDFALGHREVAERVIAKVVERAPDPAMRARAARVRDTWHAAP